MRPAPPLPVIQAFTVLNPTTTYTLQIHNGGLVDSQFEKVSSSVFILNGIQIVGPQEFNQTVTFIEKPVSLNLSNELSVEVRGKPGGGITVTIIGVDTDPPTITATATPAPNANGWNNTDVTVSFDCQDATSGIAACTAPVLVSTEGANQTITGTATDQAGNSATTSVTVNLDKTPPGVGINSPADGTKLLNASSVTVTGNVFEGLSGVVSVTCNGTPVSLVESALTCEVPLTDGANSIIVQATDVAGNTGSSSATVSVVRAPVVRIISPVNLSLVNASPITVTGTVDDPNATVSVNGVSATVSAGAFTAAGVSLREGANLITATATDAAGNVGIASIAVARDTTPPTVRIDSPADGAVLTQSRVTVTGRVSDVATSMVPGEAATVTVNGVPAAVSNGTFLVPDLVLKRGPNTIIAMAEDRAGNTSVQTTIVTLQELAGQRINLVSGNNQTGVIGSSLANPLVVSLTDANGNPVSGRPVTFTVSRGDGLLTVGAQQARSINNVLTDAVGQAAVSFTLGTRSGAGNQRVTATAVGFVGEIIFCASALPSAATQIKIVSGENQRGVVGQALPEPFTVFVHDAAGNPVAGVPVSFQVTRGGGTIGGTNAVTVSTNQEGRAVAVLTLDSTPGINRNIVQASFAGMTGLPATFTASGVVPGPPAGTTVSGVVLDNSNLPIAGVTASIEGTTLQAITDAQGQFTIPSVPVGTHLLRVDGSTTTRLGVWPALEFEITTIAGQDNTIGMPIFLLPLDAPNAKIVGGSLDVTLTMKDVPGFSLTVLANSATFLDGSTVGQVMVTQVHSDKVPMPPIEGAAPRLVWTVQPAGVVFNPPARITYPNLDNLKPGQVVDIFSFDHDLGQFVSVGTGTVSEDGSVIISDPGVGIRKAGWGYPEPPPEPTTTADGPPSPIPGALNPVEGSTGELAVKSNNQGDGKFSLEGKFRSRGVDPVTGERIPKPHKGVDILGPIGAPVKAATDGTVFLAKFDPADAPPGTPNELISRDGGNMVIIRHVTPEGVFFSRYLHLNKPPLVSKDGTVTKGQVIGEIGVSGNARTTDQPHLHFEIRKDSLNGTPLDPTGIVQPSAAPL